MTARFRRQRGLSLIEMAVALVIVGFLLGGVVGTVGALQLAGAPAPGGATPVEYATRVEREIPVDHRSLVELARFVTRAIYAPGGVGEPAALRAAVLRTHLDHNARELMPWYRRAWARLDPRLVRQRLVGDRPRRRPG